MSPSIFLIFKKLYFTKLSQPQTNNTDHNWVRINYVSLFTGTYVHRFFSQNHCISRIVLDGKANY